MRRVSAVLLAMFLAAPVCLVGQAVKVLHPAGAEHGFLVLRNAAGAVLASGELTQEPYGDNIKLRVVFHFFDGSVDDETTIYSQGPTFRLVSDRHIQRGRSFPHPIDMTVDVPGQQVRFRDLSPGKEKDPPKTEHMELPPDVADGVLFLLLQNLQPNSSIEVPYVASAPNPRMVKLAIAQEGEEPYKVAGRPYKAIKYDIKVKLGGVAGVVAPMIGEQPADYHVWVSESSVPVVLRIEGQFYADGPIWTVFLASPVW
jgi:hypothetical protein